MTITPAPIQLPPRPPAPRTAPTLAPGTWLVAAQSGELPSFRPIGRIVDGVPVVLFRDASGRAVALEDRCPHKNVALSLGRVAGNSIQCRYHGWRFDPAGELVDVPCHSPEERMPRCRVPRYAVVEQDGWIWVRLSPWPGQPVPPSYPRFAGYFWFELEYTVRAPVDLILENGLDCSHTGFAHEGLFRSAPKQFVTARVEETPTGVRAETLGEEAQGANDVRGRLGGKHAIQHVDEVILPHTLRVDYRMGDRAHFITVLVCTPESHMRTRIYNRMGVRYGRITPLVGWYLRRLTRKVVAQDVEILESQAARIRRFGRREFRTVSADLAASWMQRASRLFADGRSPAEPLRRRDVVYKL
ncbi:MAG: Rieske 2Fe-2S domain-containing protein [Gemmatimonadales bacterium]